MCIHRSINTCREFATLAFCTGGKLALTSLRLKCGIFERLGPLSVQTLPLKLSLHKHFPISVFTQTQLDSKHINMYIYIYIYIYIHTYIHTYIFVYTHTHMCVPFFSTDTAAPALPARRGSGMCLYVCACVYV